MTTGEKTIDVGLEESLLGWHWLPKSRLMQHRRSKILIEAGSVTKVRSPLVLCKRGLHASERAIDSLQYAPGPIVCRVELSGEILRGGDKVCATERRVLWLADATRTLHEFALWCARGALERERAAGREPDARCWNAVDVKQRWLDGTVTNEELAAAWTAAGAAAWDAQNTELTRRLLAVMPEEVVR